MGFFVVLLLAVGTTIVDGAHFRGGTMNWKPTGNPGEVQVWYNMGFNGFRGPNEAPPGGHYRCSNDAKAAGRLLGTTGYLETKNAALQCIGCGGSSWKDMEWRCTDFDIDGGWDIGGDSVIMTLRDINSKAVVYLNQCCWLGPLKNAPLYHDHQGYKMMTEIDLRPRPDNQLINSSPITSPIPEQLFHSNCQYHFEIPVTDPDNDAYRCRYTEGWDDECYNPQGQSGKYADICYELDYITVHENCTLVFDTSGGEGHYAVRVMIEDLDANGDPLSKVSLSFLLEVSPDATTCNTPTVIAPVPPNMCKTIPVGQLYQETVVAEAATADLPIIRIETSKPTGMNVSELHDYPGDPANPRKSVDIEWIPTFEQLGRHNLGFNVVDKDGFSSGWSFISLNVAEGHLLHPVPAESNPSSDSTITSMNGWTVKFNRPIRRPTHPAYITLTDEYGTIVDRLDASKEEQVTFSDQEISFSVKSTDVFGTHTYRLRVESGVAIDTEQAKCMVYSSPGEWSVEIQGAEKPQTQAPTEGAPRATPPPIKKPVYKCTPGEVDVTAPSGAEEGEECFIHLEETAFTVSQNNINMPYKLCCPSICEEPGPPGPPGTPGPPGCV